MKTYRVTVYNDRTVWKFEGKLHRENGPAVEYVSGSKYWYIKGLMHRENGPAVEWPDGSKFWYINGVRLTEEQFNSRHVKELSIDELEKILGHKVKIVKK